MADDLVVKVPTRTRTLIWLSLSLVGILLAFMLARPVGVLAASSEDRNATRTLLLADHRLVKEILNRAWASDTAVVRAAEELGRECKGVLRGAPDESVSEEDGPLVASPKKLSGRAQGEVARSELEEQTINEEIGETISAAAGQVLRGPYEAYIAVIVRLTWTNATVNALVRKRVAQLQEVLNGPPVTVCTEMRAWAASGFHVLAPGSKNLQEIWEARGTPVLRGDLKMLLRPYENAAELAIVRRTLALDQRLREKERSDERLAKADDQMRLVLGEKLSRFQKLQLAPVIAKRHSHADTTLVVRGRVDEGSSGSCRREVEVEIEIGNGGSSGGVCLDGRRRPRPSGNCSGSVETIELATLPEARRVRVRLNGGKTTMVPIVHVPVKDGGPAGLFVETFRGPYPVSLKELDRYGRVLRTVNLSGVNCHRGDGSVMPPRFINLVTVTAPAGESLTISASLVSFGGHTDFSVEAPPAARSSQLEEEDRGTAEYGALEHRPAREFQWNLSTECAPHAYTLIDGILTSPGAIIVARTPAGLVTLTKVELSASTHAGGPLFYGTFSTPPTELVIERSDGSILYTENFTAKAAEETEFCEGYAER